MHRPHWLSFLFGDVFAFRPFDGLLVGGVILSRHVNIPTLHIILSGDWQQ
jgi:hypothetical protein